jgi:CPA1 family monovalent cation:H+ antiporter
MLIHNVTHMPHNELLVALALALLIAGLSVAARRLRIASPILMLLAGAALAFLPSVPAVRVNPELVLLLLLPPLLYSSGVGMSWRGFRSNLRPILLLAIGCVLFTAAAVAVIVHYLLGVSWAVGFVLGAIVSPPDAVAPMAVLRAMHLPRRLVTILEGESLVNDATALVTLGFALAAVGVADFSLGAAVVQFVVIVGAEILYGVAIGYLMLGLRHRVADPRAEVLLALATPFIAFWLPHAVGGSGVIACVATGLYVSWNGRALIRPATRLQGFFIWDLVTWAIEALVFLLAGLQARAVVESMNAGGWPRALAAGAIVSVAVIVVRFVWVYPATYLPRLLFPVTCRADPLPDWRQSFLLAFSGLRGVVSLAAALLIPLTVDGGPFPDRDLVLFATYSVIVVTLVGLGSALPALVRGLGLQQRGAAEAARNRQDEQRVRLEALDAVLESLQRNDDPLGQSVHGEALRRWHADRRELLQRLSTGTDQGDDSASAALDLQLLDIERTAVGRAYAENRITDEARRRIERELDLEDARVRHALVSAGLADVPGRDAGTRR